MLIDDGVFKIKALIKNQIRFILIKLITVWFAISKRTYPVIANQICGVNLIGFYRAELGMGQVMRNLIASLSIYKTPFRIRKLNVTLAARQNDQTISEHIGDYCTYPVNIITINPDVLYRLPIWLKNDEWKNRYNIGYWFWELEKFPRAWHYARFIIDEVWVNTDFVAQSVQRAGFKVQKIPFGIECQLAKPYDRSEFNLPVNPYLFLTSFDFNSSIFRKNPQAVIQAFQQAFPSGHESVGLVIKTINGHLHLREYESLKRSIGHDPRMILLDAYMTQEKALGLQSVCDAYISLHRSEGLGLGMAQAMYLGKPVIGTAYSGNLEFMNASNSILVPYDLVSVRAGEYSHYPGQYWANPSVMDAANVMIQLVANPNQGRALGQKASDYMRMHHSLAQMEGAIKARLCEIRERLS